MYIARPSAAILPKCSLLASCCCAFLPVGGRPSNEGSQPQIQFRTYASHSNPPTLSWPSKPLSQLTPYEIFNQPHSSAYQKTTFYQLAKLYHPDCAPTADHPSAYLSKATRTERFRLIVAANALLSDPTKKKTYDVYGVGWNGTSSHIRSDPRRPTAATYASGPWKTSPAGNATWEDWERWYRSEGMRDGFPGTSSSSGSGNSNDSEAPKPFTTHTNFVTIILLLSFTGVLIQLARVDSFTTTYEQRRDRRNRDIQRDLWRVRKEAIAIGGKDGRVQAFLRMRDPEGHGGLEAVREERMRRLLPDGEVCLSGDVSGKDLSDAVDHDEDGEE
ncbi:hypothetical protein H072_1375 [Dactylellina haptotyla CBS 200.50]|uniref:J domain-containing protein n=1 Tax=Dactylellina haptotyla (strain CBS 200.50) TaxID=1284197 RepID=S8AP43_DACHA|nr:hypothetical protein H072_1375 [Dactylellina haptotyla CBS 200.50]